MKRSNTFVLSFVVLSLLVLLLTASSAAIALLARTQTISYTLTPSNNITIQKINLGSITGGSSSSQTFNGVLALSSTSGGAHTVTATLTANSTLCSKFDVSFVASNGSDLCDLALNSMTCSWTVSLSSPQTYNEVSAWQANDGISASGSAWSMYR